MLTFPRTPSLCHPFLFIRVSLASITLQERGVYRLVRAKVRLVGARAKLFKARARLVGARARLALCGTNTLACVKREHSWKGKKQPCLSEKRTIFPVCSNDQPCLYKNRAPHACVLVFGVFGTFSFIFYLFFVLLELFLFFIYSSHDSSDYFASHIRVTWSDHNERALHSHMKFM